MVLGNLGVFAYSNGITNPDLAEIAKNMENQIVSAFNLGVANSAPNSGSEAYTSEY